MQFLFLLKHTVYCTVYEEWIAQISSFNLEITETVQLCKFSEV